MAQGFKSIGLPDPRYDVDGEVCFRLRQTIKGYSNQDPAKKHQKALPIKALKLLIRLATASNDPKSIAIAQAVEIAFFFAMRSCEYSKTCSSEESKRTKILRVRNFRFFWKKTLIPHNDPRLPLADFVSIEFEFQKNAERNETVGMHRTKANELCPVLGSIKLLNRIRSLPGTDKVDDRKVNLFLNSNGDRKEISSHMIRSKLRSAVTAIGEQSLGFKAEDIGCHSIRSGAAMAMCLAKISSYTIMIVGRWKSTAFLDYIRKQVAEFSLDISNLMVTHGDFFTTPDLHFNRDSDSPAASENIDGRAVHRGFFHPVDLDALE